MLNACDDLARWLSRCPFLTSRSPWRRLAGHYCPTTLSRDLERLQHDPDIWITGMKPGEEDRILGRYTSAVPDKKIRMLSRGTVITV